MIVSRKCTVFTVNQGGTADKASVVFALSSLAELFSVRVFLFYTLIPFKF